MNAMQETTASQQHQAQRALGQRLLSYCAGHWDLNQLWQLREDIRQLIAHADRDTPVAEFAPWRRILDVLDACLAVPALPDAGQNETLQQLCPQFSAAFTTERRATPRTADATDTAGKAGGPSIRLETPPAAYWRQWADDAGDPAAQLPVSENASPPPVQRMPTMSPAPETPKPANPAVAPTAKSHRIYHLTGYGELSVTVDQLLEQAGMSVELLNDDAELAELLQALPADLILIDSEFSSHAESIIAIIENHKKTQPKPLRTVQITDPETGAGDLTVFSGMDALISASTDARSIVGRIDQLLRFGKSDQFRVLIVEDDRSQAMFAEGILRNAEVSTRVLLEADNLLANIGEYQPDLILMDLNMPNTNGILLTEMIRQNREFQNIPIVFLSGEADEDRQMDALEAGGDDFLSKPIQPRRLIAAVQNRIRRHRMITGERSKQQASSSGLMQRNEMLDLLKQHINRSEYALFFIEINGLNLLKDRLGLSHVESLLKKFAGYLVTLAGPHALARFGDSSFVMAYEGDSADQALLAFAEKLRHKIMAQQFEIQGQMIQFRVHVGIIHFLSAQGNADILLNAAERTARTARAESTGISLYRPQASIDAQRENALIKRLSEVADNQCLSHVYQPIVAVAGGGDKQFQTLLRYADEQGRVSLAADFIGLAERSNLIVTIDRWSISHALATIGQRKAMGDEIKLFVNQSNVTLLDGEQLPWLLNTLKAHSLPDNALVIEINHNDALLNQQSIKTFCQALLDAGIQFCLSRYNPRNDELRLLENLPLSYVKLAQKLTMELHKPEVRDEIKNFVDAAHRNGIEVIAHSVEDAQSAATLWMSGIDFIQGNLVQSANATLEFGFDQSVL
jgi:EAL domain-containing protein (putative c-di-GMP-specific phosphodiesterase class I)/PleD family two-component response regulator